MLSSPLDDGSTDSQSNIYTSGPLSSANSRFAPSRRRAGRPGFQERLATVASLFGITSNTLVRSSQSSSGPAGGASDGYGLGRGAAGPDRRCTTTAAGAIRAIV